MSREKLIKVSATYAIWLLVAFWTGLGLTFTMYWVDAPTLVVDFSAGPCAFLGLFHHSVPDYDHVCHGRAREQVCVCMCPYARFQSAMFDHDTLIISYDRQRGEGSKGRARLQGPENPRGAAGAGRGRLH